MVKVYITDISNFPDPKEFPEVMDGLPEKRKEKILRYKYERGRKQSLGAGLLLKKCLAEYNINIEDIRYGVNGKPEVDGIYFNLSHSHDKVVCAISNMSIGCDIERCGKSRENMIHRCFSPNEICHLERFENDEKKEEFYRLWTMKESYMKMTGEGMKLALHRLEFRFYQEVQVYRDGEAVSCYVKEYEVPEYKLTVSAEESEFTDEIEYIDLTN